MQAYRWLLPCLLLLLATGVAEAAEFTADLVISEGSTVKTGRILVRGSNYRMELEDPKGPDVIVQMFPEEDLCRVLLSRYSLYMEQPRSNRRIQSMDPFLALEGNRQYFECVDAGTEEWEGRPCRKEAFRSGGRDIFCRWTSTELSFPLKITMPVQDGHFTELRNVEVEAVPEQLFAIPEGYRRAEPEEIAERVRADPEMKAKREAWEAKQPKKDSLRPMLEEGGEFRALLGEGLAIKVEIRSRGSGDCAWSIVPMKGAEALPKQEKTGSGVVEFAADSGVDRLVLRCEKGQLSGTIDLTGLGMLVKATRLIESRNSGGGRSSSLNPRIRRVVVRVKSLEAPGESKMPVRLILTWERPQGASGENETIRHRLEPGEEKTFEKVGAGVVGGYDVTLLGPGGRAEVDLTIDYRPEGEQKPF